MDWNGFTQMTIISTIVGKIPWKKWSSHHSKQKSKMQCLDEISETTE